MKMDNRVNTDRILTLFTEFVTIDSLSFGERRISNVLKRELKDLGFEVFEDDAGACCGSDTGNLYAFLKGTDPGKTPILLSAHMDTHTQRHYLRSRRHLQLCDKTGGQYRQ